MTYVSNCQSCFFFAVENLDMDKIKKSEGENKSCNAGKKFKVEIIQVASSGQSLGKYKKMVIYRRSQERSGTSVTLPLDLKKNIFLFPTTAHIHTVTQLTYIISM